jgi:hypothetical protein
MGGSTGPGRIRNKLNSGSRKAFCAGVTLVLLLASEPALVRAAIAQANSAKDLVGLWQAKRRFGPDVRATLVTRRIVVFRAWTAFRPRPRP